MSADDPQSLAIARELTRELNLANSNQQQAQWAHEALAQVQVRVFKEHNDVVNSCQFFKKDMILTASNDQSVKIWGSDTGEVQKSFDGIHSVAVNEARLSNEDQTKFVSCGWDKIVKVTDIETAETLWSGSHEGVITCCKFSHNGKYVASGSDMDNRLQIWNAKTGEVIFNLKDYHASTITSILFSPEDDKVITTSMDRTTKFFDLKSCKNTIKLEGHINVVSDCSISGGERKFATTSWDKSIQIWDIATGMYRSRGPESLRGGHEGSVSCCDFTQDGLTLATGSYDNSIIIWDADNFVQKIRLQGHTGWVNDIVISEDQKWLLSCSSVRFIII
ncbi:WD repeat-containing protein 88 [Patella vulgata]|uniref:WD repeat-containing protein 88 n=1 Tax=Patella vulgata TaxID=6465 RepID=UPI0024A98B7F|nr:WD repeat-containing protein 88 [Patella vulgata]